MRKTFSITDELVLDRLEREENQSSYIQRLIKRDIYDMEGITQYEAGIKITLESIKIAISAIEESVRVF